MTGVDLGRCAQTAVNDRAEGRTAHPDGASDRFASSMRCAGELAGMLGGDDAMAMGHAELEDVIAVRGRELMRLLLQDHLAPSSGWRTGRRASPTCPADRGDFEPAGRAALVRDPQAQTSGSGSRLDVKAVAAWCRISRRLRRQRRRRVLSSSLGSGVEHGSPEVGRLAGGRVGDRARATAEAVGARAPWD